MLTLAVGGNLCYRIRTCQSWSESLQWEKYNLGANACVTRSVSEFLFVWFCLSWISVYWILEAAVHSSGLIHRVIVGLFGSDAPLFLSFPLSAPFSFSFSPSACVKTILQKNFSLINLAWFSWVHIMAGRIFMYRDGQGYFSIRQTNGNTCEECTMSLLEASVEVAFHSCDYKDELCSWSVLNCPGLLCT